MQVLLIRHAVAEHGVLDSHGRSQARALGDRLRWYDCAPTHLWTSPTGIGTAEVIAAMLTRPPHVEAADWLATSGAAERVRAAGLADMIAVCADEPALSALATAILGTPFTALAPVTAARIVDGRLRWRFGWDDPAAEPVR